jgi:hypothetical protein
VDFLVALRRGIVSGAQRSVPSRLTGSGVELSVDWAADNPRLEARVRMAKGYRGRHKGEMRVEGFYGGKVERAGLSGLSLPSLSSISWRLSEIHHTR